VGSRDGQLRRHGSGNRHLLWRSRGVTLVDTNIVSTFARVGALALLGKVVDEARLHVTQATYRELRKAVDSGCDFLEPILSAIDSGGALALIALTETEILSVKDLPPSLGAGEAESLAVCLNRPGTRLLTNDKRARNYAREHAIPCLDLPTCLRALWVRKVVAKKDVRKLLRRIETEQGMVIKNKERIFD
jgi:predicted nucleic acid-binding protein